MKFKAYYGVWYFFCCYFRLSICNSYPYTLNNAVSDGIRSSDSCFNFCDYYLTTKIQLSLINVMI